MTNLESIENDGLSLDECKKLVIEIWTRYRLPYTLAGDEDMKKLWIKNPLLQNLSPYYLKSYMEDAVKGIKEDLRELFSFSDNLTLIFDGWSSLKKFNIFLLLIIRYHYMGIAACFINNDWKRWINIIGCPVVHGKHTADNIYETISEVLTDLEIEQIKVTSCLTDNASNMIGFTITSFN